MKSPEFYYIGALKRALEGDLEGAYSYQEKGEIAKEVHGYSFNEAASDEFPFVEEVVETLLGSLDFTRCVRPNGTVYGTRGKCRQGTEQAKTGTAKLSSKSASRLEKELPGVGGRSQVPGKMAQETDEELRAAIERVKKELNAKKAREKRLEELDETTSKMANTLFSSRGGVSDGSIRAQNGVNNIKENLERAHLAGRGSKTTELIAKGDLEGLLRHAKEVTSKGEQDHVKTRMEEVRARQKEELKDMLAKAKERGASKEEIAKIRTDSNYYDKRDLQRAEVQAVSEYQALWRLLRP